MATDKYLNLEGLERVAEKVNQKLRAVFTMPTNPPIGDIVYYKGATLGNFIQGCTYMYDVTETYYQWTNGSDNYYTKAEAPSIGDIVYSDTTGTDSGFTIDAYDVTNDEVTINGSVYGRDNTGDVDIHDWILQDTSVILNGLNKTGDEANFYAPTASGKEGQVLVSRGADASPEWASISPNGYAPSFLDDSLVFTYGVLPEVEGNSLIFDLDND